MKNLIILCSMLLIGIFISSCETQQINDETAIEDLQQDQYYKIDKEEVQPGSKG
ncbi:hypothetical protein [Aquimarina algicola]|uniref:hypothetical protein n=1 Tax=Aquimarina algicola TaxID=2589995 RepID=UPI001CF11B5F|nr:hypothetical protein [Aquimarina algicola]